MTGAGGADPLQMGMMMGIMAAGSPMGMMPTMPTGMPPMGMPPLGMSPMGMPGMMGMNLPSGGDDAERKKKRKKERKEDPSSSECSGSPERSVSRRGRSGSKRRSPIRLEEVERFIDDNRINDEASAKIRALSPSSQRKVIARPLTGDVQNPSKVMITRVRELQAQSDRAKSSDAWSMWNSAMMGASPEAINKYVEDNDLDESASRQLRSLPPHQQAVALKWDLSKYRNPSAKFMSMANNFGTNPGPRIPFPGMMPMPGMQMMPMGMRPMMPGGIPMMPGMPGVPPGMLPMQMSMKHR